VEVYSVDEAFLDLTGMPNTLEYGRMIRQKIAQEVGIPISVGIAPSKGLCKAACYLAKQDTSYGGVVSLMDENLRTQVLEMMPVEKLWGIAKGRALSLRLANIKNARQFRDCTNYHYIQKILTKVGRQIQDELRGIVCFPITLEREKKKQIMSSRTFGNSVTTYRSLAESIACHASDVAQELRSQQSVCREVMVFVRSNPFNYSSEQYAKNAVYRFETPTASSFRLIDGALRCLEDLYRPGIEYKKSGVSVAGLQDDGEYTLGLFEAPDSTQEIALMQAMDRINTRQGPRTLHSLACGVSDHTWRMNRQFKSPRYTTCWRELPDCL
jgi:DNA polymerase V